MISFAGDSTDGGFLREAAVSFLEPNGLAHTSPGQRPGWGEEEDPQAESLPHTGGRTRMKQTFSLAFGRRP